MGSLERRLERLEEQTDVRWAGAEGGLSEGEKRRRWLDAAKARRNQALGRGGAWQARDVVKLLLGRREGRSSTEEFRARLLAWRPPHNPGVLERELCRNIFLREPGTEAMTCPEEWRESFGAGAELLRRFEAIPDEALARGWLELRDVAEDDEEGHARWRARHEEPHGITEELKEAAIGPDAAEVSEDERLRRMEEHLAPVIFGEKAYGAARIIGRRDEKGGDDA